MYVRIVTKWGTGNIKISTYSYRAICLSDQSVTPCPRTVIHTHGYELLYVDRAFTRYCEITDVLLANIEVLQDCYIYTLLLKIYIVTVILEYFDQ